MWVQWVYITAANILESSLHKEEEKETCLILITLDTMIM